jgi:hypothetical protein
MPRILRTYVGYTGEDVLRVDKYGPTWRLVRKIGPENRVGARRLTKLAVRRRLNMMKPRLGIDFTSNKIRVPNAEAAIVKTDKRSSQQPHRL